MQAGSSGGTQLEFPWCLVRQYAAWSKRLFIQWLRRARPDKPTCPIPGSLSLVNPPPVDPGWSPSHPFLRARRFYRSQASWNAFPQTGGSTRTRWTGLRLSYFFYCILYANYTFECVSMRRIDDTRELTKRWPLIVRSNDKFQNGKMEKRRMILYGDSVITDKIFLVQNVELLNYNWLI